ncbi:MAG TPA: phage tail protein [Polyangiaceae bacterium]|nr:phage tail protein [Polyangiaceae bacterium]
MDAARRAIVVGAAAQLACTSDLAVENYVGLCRSGRFTTLRRWTLARAWPTKLVAGEWDNESDENVIESVALTYDFFELVQ